MTFDEALRQGLKVVDAAAFSLCMDNRLPMLVFGAEGEDTIIRAVGGERIGTLITAAVPGAAERNVAVISSVHPVVADVRRAHHVRRRRRRTS